MLKSILSFGRNAIAFICIFFSIIQMAYAQGVAINTDNTDPDASAALDVKSTSKGVLVPRMTQAQRNAIATPATGLMIFQTDNTPGFYYYTGSAWSAVGGGGGSSASLQLVATNTASQTVETSSIITVSLASVSTAPTTGTWDGSTFTASTAGVYMVTVHLSGTGAVAASPQIVQNGSVSVSLSGAAAGVAALTPSYRATAHGILSLAAGDDVFIRVTNTSGSTSIALSTDGSTRITIVKLL